MIYVASEIVERSQENGQKATSICVPLSNFGPKVDLAYENEESGMNQSGTQAILGQRKGTANTIETKQERMQLHFWGTFFTYDLSYFSLQPYQARMTSTMQIRKPSLREVK